MKRFFYLEMLIFGILANFTVAQNYTLKNCHSHNDYLQKTPFYEAYNLGFGSIEVDVFLVENDLFVAHEKSTIDSSKTFSNLYLKPILAEIEKNSGKLKQPLQLLIDLKTGEKTLQVLQNQIIKYKDTFKKAKVNFVISGNMPEPIDFVDYDEMIQFDGRIKNIYNKKQLNRVAIFSQNFQEILLWSGKKQLDDDQQEKTENFIKAIHKKGKKLRFWATPDTPMAWHTLMTLGVDLIGTDNLAGLAKYFE